MATKRIALSEREVDVLRNLDFESTPVPVNQIGEDLKLDSRAPAALGGFYARKLARRGLVTKVQRGLYRINGRGRRAIFGRV